MDPASDAHVSDREVIAAEAPGATVAAFPSPNPFDAYAPPRIAALVEEVGIHKARLPLLPLFTLGVLAGAFISFGAMFYTVAVTGSDLGSGPTRVLGDVAFSLGLILVVVGGAELFTGNNLIAMAWAEGKVSTGALLRNWGVVYVANLLGALGTAALVHLSGALAGGGGEVGATAVAIAEAKLALDPSEAFFRGLLCNILVCLAVWLCFAAHDAASKILAIVFPISGFVALGFEHSVANMYTIPVGQLAAGVPPDVAALLANLIPVTVGNVVGSSAFIALTYWICYLRGADRARGEPPR